MAPLLAALSGRNGTSKNRPQDPHRKPYNEYLGTLNTGIEAVAGFPTRRTTASEALDPLGDPGADSSALPRHPENPRSLN